MKPLILIQALTAIITIQLSYGNTNDSISLAPISYLNEEQEFNPFQEDDSLHTLSITDIIQINQNSDARLDSVIIELRDGFTKILKKWNKKDYVYNAKGQIIREIRYYRWHDTKLTWIIGDADDFEYDSNGNEASRTKTNWNKFTEEWEIVDRYETSYDEFGNDTLQIYYYYDLGVEPVSKRVRNYDAQGNILIDSKYKWNVEENIWEGKSLSSYEYNDENIQTVIISSDWENNTWRFSNMSVSVYDSLENTRFVFYSKWDTSLSDWRNNSFWETIKDENGNYVSETYSIWNSANNKWVKDTYFGNEYVYDEQNRIVLHISSHSSVDAPSFNRNNKKKLFLYDTLGLQMIEYHYDWDADTDDWAFPVKNEYQLLPDNINQKTTFRWSNEKLIWQPTRIEKFDSAGNKVFFRANVEICTKVEVKYVCRTEQRKMFYAYDSLGGTTQALNYIYGEDEGEWYLTSGFYSIKELNNNLLTKESKYVWDFELDNWSIGNRINYYYSNDTTPQNSVDFFQIDIFPNPASDYLVIRGEELAAYNTVKVEMTDLLGRNVLTENSYSNEQPIYFNELNAGVFIIKISHLDRVLYVGQIVIK